MELAAIYLPKELVEGAKRKGLDLETELLDYLAARLELDPSRRAEFYLALAERLLEEGARLVDADPVRASEKLYKAAEECVKALAELLEFKDILEQVRGRGRWTVTDLERAVARASDLLSQDLAPSWDAANYLHVWGFHEAKLDASAIRRRKSCWRRPGGPSELRTPPASPAPPRLGPSGPPRTPWAGP